MGQPAVGDVVLLPFGVNTRPALIVKIDERGDAFLGRAQIYVRKFRSASSFWAKKVTKLSSHEREQMRPMLETDRRWPKILEAMEKLKKETK